MDAWQIYQKEFEQKAKKVVEHLMSWIQDEVQKTKAKGVILGMSGGLDCSLVARLVQLADIPLLLVGMPNQHSMEMDQGKEDIQALISAFHMEYIEVAIDTGVSYIQDTMKQLSTKQDFHGNQEMALANVPPIIRMGMLSTLGQAMNYVMIGTGNLTERTMGYFTKRGDGLSDLNPLGNLTKTEVRILARYLKLPEHIITKAPSANLWEGQSDEEEMGVKIEDIDRYLICKEGEATIINRIIAANQRAQHKLHPIPMFPYER